MRGGARRVIDAGLRRSPLQPYFTRRTAGLLSVLAYHGIDDPQRFADHLNLLCRSMRPVGLDDIVGARAGGRSLPAGSVLVTFDDGHRSVLDHAAPLLAGRGIPAIAFVVAGLVDSSEPFWWVEAEHLLSHGGCAHALPASDLRAALRLLKRLPNDLRREALDELRASAGGNPPSQANLRSVELRQLESCGIEIGNHTVTHPCLDTCGDATVATEVVEAHRRLTDILRHPPRAFAYPNGNWDPRAESHLADLGYLAAFRFDHRHASPGAHPLRLSRLRVNSDTTMSRFATILSGLHPAVHHARGGR